MAEARRGVQTAASIFDCLVSELGLVGDVCHNVEDMTDALSSLQASRNDLRDIHLSPQQTRPQHVQNWFTRVEEVEDKVQRIRQDFEKRCLCVGSFSPNIFASYAISRRAVQKRERARSLLEEYETVKNLTAERPPASCIPKHLPAFIAGKGTHLENVLTFLGEEEIKIISICGMPGVGKSELMRRVNNEFLPGTTRCDVFEFVIWVDNSITSSGVSVSVMDIQDKIARRLRLELEPENDQADPERRASPIFSMLQDKSFLLLLDNLMIPVSLAEIGIPNPKFRYSQELKQKVVLTTSSKGVCGRMNYCRLINVQCLEWDDSWELFSKTLGMGPPAETMELAKEVARECGGLPIVLTKIGGAMATRRKANDWRITAAFLKSSQIHKIPGMERENTALLEYLKQSYDHALSTDLTKSKCLLSCALWPRGCSIDKGDLVECWIGLGLIQGNSLDDTLQNGFGIITSLQDESLLLPGGNAEHQVKLQHVIRDMALWIAGDYGTNEDKWLVQAGVKLGDKHKVIKLCERAAAAEVVSLMHSSIQELPPARLLSSSCPKLTCLMLQHNDTFTHIPGAFFRSVPALSYLDLSHTAIDELPKDIGVLEMLQYLNLSFTKLKSLPIELGKLCQLKHLLLKHTNHLSTIPAGIFRALTSLQIIDMYPSRYMDWEDRDRDIARVDGKEGITSFEKIGSSNAFIKSLGIAINSFDTAKRLGRMINVCTRRLLMTCFDSPASVTICQSRFKELMKSFSLLETLEELSIAECDKLENLQFKGEEEDIRKHNEIWCLPKLEKLELRGLNNLAHIIWTGMSISEFLPALHYLKIENCSRLVNVSWVVRLPSLQHLELRNCNAMRSVVDDHEPEKCGDTFPSLMRLILVDLPKLCSICRPNVSLPSLEVLEVGCCIKLRRIHIKPQGSLLQIRGTVDWWQDLEWDKGSNTKLSLNPYFVEATV